MPLIKVPIVDYNASYAYAPPAFEGLLSTETIIGVTRCEVRGYSDCCMVRTTDGKFNYLTIGVSELWSRIEEANAAANREVLPRAWEVTP